MAIWGAHFRVSLWSSAYRWLTRLPSTSASSLVPQRMQQVCMESPFLQRLWAIAHPSVTTACTALSWAFALPARLFLKVFKVLGLFSAGMGYMGAPLPSVDSLKGLEALEVSSGTGLERTVQLMANIFDMPYVTISIIDDRFAYIKSAVGLPAAVRTWTVHRSLTADAWTQIPLRNEVIVVEDPCNDFRLKESPFVVAGPKWRFYACAPLVTSDGYRLGTLALADHKPRHFDACCSILLANFAEMTAREIQSAALQAQSRHTAQQAHQAQQPYLPSQAPQQSQQPPQQAAAAAQQAPDGGVTGVVLVDVTQPGWPILYCNSTWSALTGVTADDCVNKNFWDMYTVLGSSKVVTSGLGQRRDRRAAVICWLHDMTGCSCGVECNGLSTTPPSHAQEPPIWHCFQPAIDAGQMFDADVVERGGSGQHSFTIVFKPANRDYVDEDAQTVVITARDAAQDQSSSHYWLGCIFPSIGSSSKAQTSASSSASAFNASSSTAPPTTDPFHKMVGSSPFPDTEIGQLLGRGSFGLVFQGRWHGAPVAVKVVQHKLSNAGIVEANKEFEGMLGMKLAHPNIIRVYKYVTTPRKLAMWRADLTGASNEDSTQGWLQKGEREEWVIETWIVEELCKYGTLMDKIEKGCFRSSGSSYNGGTKMAWVMCTLVELASALTYMHSQDILHGDLSCNNVLLVPNPDLEHLDDRPFAAKLADFGLSRTMIGEHPVETSSFGTVSHMPPELLRDGRLSKASDVYAFGILMWTMYTGRRPWAGLRKVQILAKKMMGNVQPLQFDEWTPAAYRELAERCMAATSSERPSFDQVVYALKLISAKVKAGTVTVADFPVYPSAAYKDNPS